MMPNRRYDWKQEQLAKEHVGKKGARGLFRFSDTVKYVDDYQVETYVNEAGKTKKRAKYVGIWTCFAKDDETASVKLWVARALGLLLLACLMMVELVPNSAETSYLVVVPLALALLPLLYMAMGIFCLPFNRKPMRRDVHAHSFIRIGRSALAIIIFCGVSLIGRMIFHLMNGWNMRFEDIYHIGGTVLCIAICVTLIVIIRSIELHEKANDTYDPQSDNINA